MQTILASPVESRMESRKSVLFGSAYAAALKDAVAGLSLHHVVFLGKKNYWYSVIIIIISNLQNQTEERSVFDMSKQSGISRNTITRWLSFFRGIFPSSPQWQSIRGQVSSSVKSDEVPGSLVKHFLSFISCTQDALISCLKFLSLGSVIYGKTRDG